LVSVVTAVFIIILHSFQNPSNYRFQGKEGIRDSGFGIRDSGRQEPTACSRQPTAKNWQEKRWGEARQAPAPYFVLFVDCLFDDANEFRGKLYCQQIFA
jgi:hypothetical protein